MLELTVGPKKADKEGGFSEQQCIYNGPLVNMAVRWREEVVRKPQRAHGPEVWTAQGTPGTDETI